MRLGMTGKYVLGDATTQTIQWQDWGLKALLSACSLKVCRGGPALLFKVAFGVVMLMALTYTWSSFRDRSLEFGPDYLGSWTAPWDTELRNGKKGTGLRVVVFGGGDIATAYESSKRLGGPKTSWTEVMCHQLLCDTYLSFVPEINGKPGAVMSSSPFAAAFERIALATESVNEVNKTKALDYSWVAQQYPVPAHADITSQIASFLSSPKPLITPVETLWVFSLGNWEIWHLAAMPRKLATQVLDASIRSLFFYLEMLFRAAQDRNSVAYSNFYSDTDMFDEENKAISARVPPFRVFLPHLFDITLTPGFITARPEPPLPHSRSDQLRNAMFLMRYWDTVLDVAMEDWLAIPDPDAWSVVDAVDINVIKAITGKRSPMDKENKNGTHQQDEAKRAIGKHRKLHSREAGSYDMSRHIREMMVDRQLRDLDLVDHNGLGERPLEEGFLDISKPCVSHPMIEKVSPGGKSGGPKKQVNLCSAPDDHLFWDEFTVAQRAINEIATRATAEVLNQVKTESRWRA
ncbi:hypothetical protein F5Y18DRAFT_439071 [Xylariaceae sp. FL1019]|nr:hypothetical protein F5Y18DRAFT_439071 [Xylariaceae sp. FL1019]